MKINEVIQTATKYNVKLMGDDFIGYKFIGEEATFWNDLVHICYSNDPDSVNEYFTKDNLFNNNITVLEHDSEIWKS